MVRGKVVEVIEGMLYCTNEVLGFLRRYRRCFDSNSERERWLADLVATLSMLRISPTVNPRTLPWLQSAISCNGSAALYTVVVFHHTGNPRNTITAQKLRIISRRLRPCSSDSAGGPLWGVAASTACAGAFSAGSPAGLVARADGAGILYELREE